jgi:hypothetical protein
MRTTLTLATLLLVLSLNAQMKYNYAEPAVSRSTAYINFSSGIDNYSGIFGIGALFPINDDFALRAGAGFGAWGGKISMGLKYEDLTVKGIGFGIGYSHCPGFSDFDMTLQRSDGSTEAINLDLLQVGSINLTVNKNWVFKRGNVFYLESGYAIATGGSKFYRVNSNTILTPEDELLFEIMRPGGLILTAGFLMGLN